MILRRTCFVLAVLACANVASADSDGYFCTGPNYLAYQFGMAPVSPAPHRVHIVKVGDEGISAPVAFELPQFQVHGMRCGERSIEVRAFDGVHVIGLDARLRPVQYSMTPLPKLDAAASADWARTTANLGMGSRARATWRVEWVRLATDARGRDYALEMTPVRIDMCTVEITSRVVQHDSAGRELAARPILKDRFPLECGD